MSSFNENIQAKSKITQILNISKHIKINSLINLSQELDTWKTIFVLKSEYFFKINFSFCNKMQSFAKNLVFSNALISFPEPVNRIKLANLFKFNSSKYFRRIRRNKSWQKLQIKNISLFSNGGVGQHCFVFRFNPYISL